MSDLIIYEFSPIFLTLDRIGPFQESPYTIDFTNKDDLPCNFYMLVAPNGFGKTTVLDAIACAYGLLFHQDSPEKYGLYDLDEGNGRLQLDISFRYHWKGENKRVVLSILAGDLDINRNHLKLWADNGAEDMSLSQFEADSWHRMGYYGKKRQPLGTHKSDQLINELLGTVEFFKIESPDSFNESTIPAPTVLSFSAYRDIPAIQTISSNPQSITTPAHWGYQSLHKFSAHNESWLYSLDSLLVWLKWLDDGRFERAQDLLNKQVFEGSNKFFEKVQRDPPQALINVDGQHHRLDRLSSGEKNIAQLMLRIGAHMTKNTIVLIDEFDVHLHIRWQYRLFNALKSLAAREDANITVILTTHSAEILETHVNTMNLNEEGLIKGGHLIEKGMR